MDKQKAMGAVQSGFGNLNGAVMVYLDEINAGSGTKQACRSRIYELCDEKIKPLVCRICEEKEALHGR